MANAIYTLIVFASLSIGLISRNKPISSNTFISLSIVILISFFIGFRSLESGTDTSEYVKYFLNSDLTQDKFEPGFHFITIIIKSLGNYKLYLYIICALTLALLIFTAKLTGTNHLIFLGTTLSFLHGFDLLTNGIRNGLGVALALFIIALTHSITKIKTLQVATPLISGIFHMSCYIFSPLIMVSNLIPDSKKILLFLFISSFIVFFVMMKIDVDIIRNLAILYVENDNFLGKASRYILLDEGILSDNIKIYFYFTGGLLSFISINYYNSIKFDAIRIITRLSIIGFFICSLFYFSAFSYRLFILFFLPQALIVSHILTTESLRKPSIFLISVFLLLNILITYTTNTFFSMQLMSLQY